MSSHHKIKKDFQHTPPKLDILRMKFAGLNLLGDSVASDLINPTNLSKIDFDIIHQSALGSISNLTKLVR